MLSSNQCRLILKYPSFTFVYFMFFVSNQCSTAFLTRGTPAGLFKPINREALFFTQKLNLNITNMTSFQEIENIRNIY